MYYFSDCQAGAAAGCVAGNNANPGTQAAPKQNLSGVSIDTLPAGSQLLFARGGSWAGFSVSLHNLNATPTSPLVLDAYGAGAAPLLRASGGNAITIGGNWGNTSNDGGYTIRNLHLDGMGTANWGVWLVQNVRNVTLDNVDITGFLIGVHSSGGSPYGVTGFVVRNSRINRNSAMGFLGTLSDSVFENNTFDGNNFSGSGFHHAIYASGGSRNVIRNNAFNANSAVNGVCSGGNVTVHGTVDGLTIEGNTITQAAAVAGCYGFSITAGYTTAEYFRNVVIRGNTVVNVGLCAVCASSAPGIVVESNKFINTQNAAQYGVLIPASGGGESPGDDPNGPATVRNNTMCQTTPQAATGTGIAAPSGSTVAGNVLQSGAAATTGACAS